MNGYGHTARAKHKLNISRRQVKKRFKINRQDLKSAMLAYIQAGGKITILDDYDRDFSQIVSQVEDHNPTHWQSSKDEISEIAGHHEATVNER